MRKYLFLITATLIITAQKVLCAVTEVSTELEHSLRTHSNEPNPLSIIFALLIVIFLIYITGLIYSKLNIMGAKTVREHLRNYDLSKVIVLSTTQLGPGRNLHVIELNNKRYLIGATQNSINLIKELEETGKKVSKHEESKIDNPIDVLYGENEEKPELKMEDIEEFNVHKKYL